MTELVAPLVQFAQSHTVSATRPDTAGTGGVSCATWTRGAYGIPRVYLAITADAARTLADPTGGTAGVEVWGQENGVWSLIATLNATADIAIIGAAQGWATVLELGRGYDRLGVFGTPSGGTITARFVPLEVQN